MQTTTIKNRLLATLLTLCMVLSLVPVSAFADGINYIPKVSVAYEYINYKTGDTPRATASVTEGNCTVAYEYWREIYQKEEGGVWSGTGRYWYSDSEKMASLSSDKRITKFEAGHSYSYNIVLVTDRGYFFSDDETVVSVGEHEWGTPGRHTNLEIKEMSTELRIYSPYSFDLPAESQPSTISAATVENAKFDYQPGDAPQATATVAATDADKYEIAYECWQQFDNNDPVAAWYSDNDSHGSLPTITEFENGKKYVYSLMLKPKDGYSFSSETVITVNGQKVSVPFAGGVMYIPAIKTITPTKQNNTITAVAVENVKLNYQPGNAPQASAKQAGADQDKYDILYECWGKREKDADDTLTTVAYWYSDESYYSEGDVRFNTFEKGGRYQYSVRLKAKDGYTFDSNLSDKNVTLNGQSLPFGSWVNVLDDGRTCLIQYGAETRPGQAVEKIDFDAVINFDAGDKPRFSSGVVDPIIDTDHQRWDANDGSGYGITSSDYWNKRYNGKLITEFEAGKSYTYGVYFKISDLGMEEGYRFDKNTKLYINGKEITLKPDQVDVDDNGETIWFSNVLTMEPTTVTAIDVVEINDVTVSFKDGDKPVFTGKTPDGAHYSFRCEWWELDSETGLVSTEPEWGSGIYKNKITAFEAGKTYHYGVYVTAVGFDEDENVTYTFAPDTKLKINGKFVNYKRYEGDTSDGSDGTMWVLTDLTMTPKAGGSEKYTVTYTDGVDDEEIFEDQTYTVASGETTPAFDGTPTREGYTFAGWKPAVAEYVTDDATYEATWTSDPTTPSKDKSKTDKTTSSKTGKTASPKTGDTSNVSLWFALLFVSGGAAIGTTVVIRKKKYHR